MSLGTILLIAVAVVVGFLMFRVGRGSREAAHAHVPGIPDTEEQRAVDQGGHANHGQDSEGGGRKRGGCC
jgi:hypothetical protein